MTLELIVWAWAGGVALVCLILLLRRMRARHLHERLHLHLESGDCDGATRYAERLAYTPWIPRKYRKAGWLDLGLLRLEQDELEPSREALQQIEDSPDAQLALAWIALLLEESDDAQRHLERAWSSEASPARQSRFDLIRLVLVFRSQGPAAARRLGDRLIDDSVESAVLQAVLASAHAQEGNRKRAADLLGPHVLSVLESIAWRSRVPELTWILEDADLRNQSFAIKAS